MNIANQILGLGEGKAAYADDGEIKNVIESVEKELGGDGRVLVRLSGTEPKIRVMLEGTDLGVIEKLADKIVDKIKERLSVILNGMSRFICRQNTMQV